MALFAFALAAGLAMAHVFGSKLQFLGAAAPRSRWLSFAGGTSVAYIFVHLLPELAAGQRALEKSGAPWEGFIESHVWLVALLGLVAFFGLERAAKCSRPGGGSGGDRGLARHGLFWLHIASFAGYNVLIGYLLLNRLEGGLSKMVLFWFAMLLHFVVNDFALRQHHRDDYTRIGRWVLAVAVIAGALLGMGLKISEAWIAVLLAFIGGGVVLNVMKEELPDERESSFVFFAGGAAAYTAVLLAL